MKIHFVLPLCIEQFVPDLKNGGVESWRNFANRRQGFENFIARVVKDKDHEVFLWCMTNLVEQETRLKHKDGYTLILVPSSFKSVNIRYPFELSIPLFEGLFREFIENNIDVIHLHEYYTTMALPIAALCRLFKKPLISHNHGGKIIGRGPPKILFGFTNLLSIWFSSRILTINREEITKLVNVFRFPERKVNLCPYGIDVDVFQADPKEEAKSRTGLLSSKKYILFVGRLSDFHKGISYLLKAFSKIIQKNPEVNLIIVGGGPDELWLQKLTEQLGVSKQVLFVGAVMDQKLLASYYNSSDVAVVPSLFEAFGIVVIEAMACNKPVVASRVGGIKEIIEDGLTGILVSPGEAKELEEKILWLLNNPKICQKLGAAARKRIETQYSFAALGERLHKIYCDTVSS